MGFLERMLGNLMGGHHGGYRGGHRGGSKYGSGSTERTAGKLAIPIERPPSTD